LFAGKETIHQLYGTRIAVLAGDFMFAQSSWFLANLENIEVIKLISQVPMGSSILSFSSVKLHSVFFVLTAGVLTGDQGLC
jgi:hypothetical protein